MQFLEKEVLENPEALANVFFEMKEAYRKGLVPMTMEQSTKSFQVMMSGGRRDKRDVRGFQ